jgi:hypothetical protein
MCVQAKRVTVPCVQLAVLRDPDVIQFFSRVPHPLRVRVPLYDNAVSTITPVAPQPTATDMNREGFSLDLFLEMHRIYDVDQVFLVTHRCDDGGARLEVSKVEEGELVWTGTNDYIPPEILNDQFFTIVDDSTVVID